jgi:predicted O-methyltransferase YrrM
MSEITPKPIHDYCVEHSSNIPAIFDEIATLTKEKFGQAAGMQVGALEGNFLSLITKISGAKTILEFGTFTGHSSTAFALALPTDGKITALDRDPIATSHAKTFWEKAGIANKVELIVGDARDSVKKLISEVKAGTRPEYDLAFIDADKGGYLFYFESCLALVKTGGVILVDNVLWGGYVVTPEDNSDRNMAEFNDTIKNDPRIELVMLPVRDGITLARKVAPTFW